MDTLNAFILRKEHHDILALIKGFRNGLIYGFKIRFPHALVMTFLFRNGSFESKLRWILKATFQHGWNLSRFVFLYKLLLLLFKKLLPVHSTSKNKFYKPEEFHTFLAGCIGGYLVFSSNNPINQQIVLYLFSRVALGLAKHAIHHIPATMRNADKIDIFPYASTLVWGIVMWLFRYHRTYLQPGLQGSMQYLYNDSDVWDSLRNWIWHNK
ncbi:Peroxisomal membrane protein 4 [Coelomomyces lativittatus]|nr:Peroxisomal membrane protein 4 [Coelomomyces lativittatus]KAJ1515549.1 Peroxisomal membrane protein 4 [Coelomomyces lativittatus]KAJ1518584.1 Peroxisomal membrane protein 4 [Coelomomyces lativittatus]